MYDFSLRAHSTRAAARFWSTAEFCRIGSVRAIPQFYERIDDAARAETQTAADRIEQ